MSNPNGSQGTRWERERRDRWRDVGIRASRIEKQGAKDQNDLWLIDHPYESEHGWVEETKATQQLSVTTELKQAVKRTGPRTVLAWKRMLGKKSEGRRSSFSVVVMLPATFEVLLRAYEHLRAADPQTVERLWGEAS